MAIIANDLKKGMAVRWKDDICIVLETQHRTPGNLHAFVQGTFRSLKTGKSFTQRFGSAEKVELVNVSRSKWEYSYQDPTGYTFLNPDTYENLTLAPELVEESKPFLTEGMLCEVLFVEDKAVEVEVPSSVTLKVVNSPEGVRGDSSSNVMKPAVLETGLTLQVPLFIQEGEMIRVDTREKKYLGRA
ncbi:MAG: elongation factor P [Verrucomicrobiota bacterium]